jgi:hypothetical protein
MNPISLIFQPDFCARCLHRGLHHIKGAIRIDGWPSTGVAEEAEICQGPKR